MPFTPAHVAAVLPLMRGRAGRVLVPSALAIGAMTPDLPLFLPRWAPVSHAYARTHSVAGLPTWDLAIGVVAFLVWLLVRRPLLELAPGSVRSRWQPAPVPRGLVGWLAVVVSVLVGAVTHIVWDAFTHGGRAGVRLVPWLAESTGGLEHYKYAQFLSGGVGLVIVGWVAVQALRRSAQRTPADLLSPHGRRVAVLVLAAAVVVVVVTYLVLVVGRVDELGLELAAYLWVTRTIGWSIGIVVGWAVVWHLLRRRAAVRSAREPSGVEVGA